MTTTFSRCRKRTASLHAWICIAAIIQAAAAEPFVLCSPNGTHLVTVSEQGRIDYRNASDKTAQGRFYICHPTAISFSEDGKFLAAAGGQNGSPARIKVWRLDDHQQLCEIAITDRRIHALALSSDGRLIVGAGADGRIEVWRVSNGQTLWSRTVSGPTESIRISTDSRRLVVRAENGVEHSFDIGNGRPLTHLAD